LENLSPSAKAEAVYGIAKVLVEDMYLRNFLDGDHFPVPIYRLFGNGKEIVLEDFRALRIKR
jgi:hypothetical protein